MAFISCSASSRLANAGLLPELADLAELAEAVEAARQVRLAASADEKGAKRLLVRAVARAALRLDVVEAERALRAA